MPRHRGRIFSTAGDGVVAEFHSVVEAIRCAVEIQHEIADRNAAVPENRRMQFRIGVNLGDVIAEENDLYGTGVNVAARSNSSPSLAGNVSRSPFTTRCVKSSRCHSRISANSG